MLESRNDLRGAQPEHDADDAADRAQRDRFDQELQEDVASMRADGHAHADLARAFGHAHEHDVHDADAPDDERNAGDRAEQAGHDFGCGGRGFGDFLLVADGEVVVATGPDVVTLAEKRSDLLLRWLESASAMATWTLMERNVVPPSDAFHRAGVRDDDNVVLVGARG